MVKAQFNFVTDRDDSSSNRSKQKPERVPAIVNALYTEHYVALRQFTMSKVNNSDMADEVLQDLFIKMVSRAQFDDIDDVRSYLYRVILNLINDVHRRDIRKDKTAAQLELIGDSETVPGLNPQNLVASQQELRVFQSALEELPENCREILHMSRFEGLTHGQIAERLGISKSWVEKNIIKGLRFCRQKLNRHE